VTCSPDGTLFALRLNPSTVVVLAYPSKDTAMTLQYIDRRAVGVAFGPPPFVGIGMDSGDGNKINLSTEAVHRTDTHPGRSHNRWALSSGIDQSALPPAYKGRAPAKAPAGAEPAAEPRGKSNAQILIGFGLVAVGVILLISQCQ
jgi:hypothetical protein